jgi:hypothetical protein
MVTNVLWIITTSVFRIEPGIEIRDGMRPPVARVKWRQSRDITILNARNPVVGHGFFASQVEAQKSGASYQANEVFVEEVCGVPARLLRQPQRWSWMRGLGELRLIAGSKICGGLALPPGGIGGC